MSETMDRSKLFSSLWVRIVIFFWMIVFPIVFIGIPVLEMVRGERNVSMMPVWAFVIWMSGPLVVSIVLKNISPDSERNGDHGNDDH